MLVSEEDDVWTQDGFRYSLTRRRAGDLRRFDPRPWTGSLKVFPARFLRSCIDLCPRRKDSAARGRSRDDRTVESPRKISRESTKRLEALRSGNDDVRRRIIVAY